MTSRAHSCSLPLFIFMEGARGRPTPDVVLECIALLEKLGLKDHITFNVDEKECPEEHVIKDTIAFRALDEYGQEVLDEFKRRITIPPCPQGECQYGDGSSCLWCGHPKK